MLILIDGFAFNEVIDVLLSFLFVLLIWTLSFPRLFIFIFKWIDILLITFKSIQLPFTLSRYNLRIIIQSRLVFNQHFLTSLLFITVTDFIDVSPLLRQKLILITLSYFRQMMSECFADA